jgi:histidinol dehydrogenase
VKVWKSSALPLDWFKRQAPDEKTAEQVESNVKAIVSTVVKNGDAALITFTEQFDEARLETKDLRVTSREIKDAYNEASQEQVAALKFMKNKVSAFEKLTLEQAGFKTSKDGVLSPPTSAELTRSTRLEAPKPLPRLLTGQKQFNQ